MRLVVFTTLLTLSVLPNAWGGRGSCRAATCAESPARQEPRPPHASIARVELCSEDTAQHPPLEKRPWVGVSVSPASGDLRNQLKVTDGVGLVVEFVQTGSPGADAGLKPFDLLLKLDDQWLINPDQFAVLIRMHHAGDEVKLTLLRQGEQQTVPVKLREHEFSAIPDWDNNMTWPTAPRHDLSGPSSKPGELHHVERVFTWLDGHRQVTVTIADGHTRLAVLDNQTGRTLFDGLIDTPEQRKNVPDDVKGVLDSLTKISGAFGDVHPEKHGSAGDSSER